jgi:hypothetical protein
LKKALILALFIASCSHSDRWVLKAYDKDNGYTFVRNGVSYQTRCFATGYPMLPNNVPDLDPESMPPNPAFSGENACSDILPYLGKSVPGLRQVEGSILLFTEEKNYRLEFEIKKAK